MNYLLKLNTQVKTIRPDELKETLDNACGSAYRVLQIKGNQIIVTAPLAPIVIDEVTAVEATDRVAL